MVAPLQLRRPADSSPDTALTMAETADGLLHVDAHDSHVSDDSPLFRRRRKACPHTKHKGNKLGTAPCASEAGGSTITGDPDYDDDDDMEDNQEGPKRRRPSPTGIFSLGKSRFYRDQQRQHQQLTRMAAAKLL